MSINQAILKCVTSSAVIGLSVSLALAAASSPAAAQRDSALAVVSYAYQGYYCNQMVGPAVNPTAAASCATTSPVTGTGSANASVNNATRTYYADGRIAATGYGSPTPTGAAAAISYGQILYSGTNTPTDLVFQYAVTHSDGATGPADTWGDAMLQLRDFNTNPTINWSQYSSETSERESQSTEAWTDGNGNVTFTVPYNGSSAFIFSTYLQADGNINYTNYNAIYGSAFGHIATTLTRVYATDGSWNSADAQFDAQGNGIISTGQVDTTPEPNALALLGTGLVGLVPIIRRRRSNG